MGKIEKGTSNKPETQEKKAEPIVNIHFFFGANKRKADLLGLPLDGVDIYISERSNVDELTKQAYKLVCQGKLTPQEAIDNFLRRDKTRSPYWEAELGELEALHKKNITIDFVDLPKDHWLSKPFRRDLFSPKLTN